MALSRKTTDASTASRVSACRQPGKILDLFAGAGGWEEALRMLGLNALGIETEPWACETAHAAGHERLQADVSETRSSRVLAGVGAGRIPAVPGVLHRRGRDWVALISRW